jgi:prepilin-type N-terminal cleavage/methylation domain-containing protein
MRLKIKKGFSFIEVIISVVILSYLGMAILNFNSFNKKAMYNNIEKQNTLLIASPFLYIKNAIDSDKSYKLYDFVSFKNLSDEDSRFLKSIELKGKKTFKEKIFLYNDGKKDYFINYGDISIKYKKNKPLHFILVERPL